MFHTKHEEGLNPRGELPAAADTTIADRLLEALRLDYLNTLRAEGRIIDQNLEEVFSSSSQHSQQMEESGDNNQTKHTAASEREKNKIMRNSAKKPAASDSSDSSEGEEDEASNEDKPRDMSNRKETGNKNNNNNNKTNIESPVEEEEEEEEEEQSAFEFAYQRLPSVEELRSPQCFFDEPADSAAASLSSPQDVWNCASEQLQDKDLSRDDDAAAAAAEQQQQTAQVSSFDSDEGKKRNEGCVAAQDGEQQQQQQQQQQQPVRHRHLLLGERPLEPQSAAFIAEVMRGLALKDPREHSSPNPAK